MKNKKSSRILIVLYLLVFSWTAWAQEDNEASFDSPSLNTTSTNVRSDFDVNAQKESQRFDCSGLYLDSGLIGKELLQTAFDNQNLSGFHLFSHGRPGELLIEGKWKNAEQIATWMKLNESLSNQTHLNIYGCHFAQGEKGKAAVKYLEVALGVAVAASDDMTGIDGDWDLEVGENDNSITIPNYNRNLQACDCTEYIYLNETTNGGAVHKFAVSTDGTLTEVAGKNGMPWFSSTNEAPEDGLPSPHGVGVDLNGSLYFGESFAGDIRKMNCSGEIEPESNFVVNNGGFNLASIDNRIFVKSHNEPYIRAYNSCTGASEGYVEMESIPGDAWGFHIDDNGTFYVVTGYAPFDWSWNAVYIFTPTESDFQNNTVYPWTWFYEPGTDPVVGETKLSDGGLKGITTDNDGNIYIVMQADASDFEASGNTINCSRIYKYSPAGEILAISSTDCDETDGVGWYRAAGIVYSETCDCLFVSTESPLDDCVYRFNTDLTNTGITGTAVGPVAGGQAKGISINKECCPATTPQTLNRTVCGEGNGEQFFLNEIFGCDGVVCEGMWTETVADPTGNIVFDACDLSVTVNGLGCATFTLEKTTPAGVGEQCGAFNITVNVCSEIAPTVDLMTNIGTCNGNVTIDNAAVTIANGTNTGEANYSLGSTYSGPNFGDAANIDISSGAGTLTGLAHDTEYTVRTWSVSGNCFNDSTLTTPNLICTDLELVKTADKSVAKIGDELLWTLEIVNKGLNDVYNVQVTDTLPNTVSQLNATATRGIYAADVWTIDTLHARGKAQLFITTKLLKDTTVCNVAELYSFTSDPDATTIDIDSTPNNDDGDQSEDDEDKALVFVTPEIDLSVMKAVSQSQGAVGDAISYTITVKNDGPSIAHNVKLYDKLPVGLTQVGVAIGNSDQTAAAWAYANDTLTMDSISVGETITMTVNANITSINSTITNCAEIVAADEDDVDSAPGNASSTVEDDEACATIDPIEYDIELFKDILKNGYVLGNRKVKVGEEITYILRVTNWSSSNLIGVVVEDQLPIGVEFQSMNGDGTYDENTGLWTIGNVSPKSQLRMNIVVKVTAEGTITNTAEVSAMGQPDKDSIPGNGIKSEDDQETVTMEVVKPKKKLEIRVGN